MFSTVCVNDRGLYRRLTAHNVAPFFSLFLAFDEISSSPVFSTMSCFLCLYSLVNDLLSVFNTTSTFFSWADRWSTPRSVCPLTSSGFSSSTSSSTRRVCRLARCLTWISSRPSRNGPLKKTTEDGMQLYKTPPSSPIVTQLKLPRDPNFFRNLSTTLSASYRGASMRRSILCDAFVAMRFKLSLSKTASRVNLTFLKILLF
mmetsp:Transcript_4803/g.12204  ORF Transcript_4803/g.12204 Transcript_4803/m.12204 type:complete len:202 (-) Transcript_4803:421-1026(-)